MSDFMNYNSRFSQILNRFAELVLLNFIFLLTCLPIITVGASVTALYSITLKMVRNEEGYIIRGYFNAFKENFKQTTILWMIGLLLFFQLHILSVAASVNSKTMFQIYTVIIWALGILYSLYFLLVFPLTATFQNTLLKIAQNTFIIIISHLPWVLASYLIVTVPLAISLGINTKIWQYSLLFWILIGFSLVAFLSSFCLNRIFIYYMDNSSAK